MKASYAIRRLAVAAASWICTCLLLAMLLNQTLEAQAAAQVTDIARGMLSGMSPAEMQGRSPAEMRKLLEGRVRVSLGLDRPRAERILRRAASLAVLDLDGRMWTGEDLKIPEKTRVRYRILQALRPTLVLFSVSTLVAFAFGLPIGLLAARKPTGRLDRFVAALAALIYGAPAWWIGGFLVFFFGIENRIFPFGALHSSPPPEGALALFLDGASFLVLPVLSIALVRTWGVAYITRSIMTGVVCEDYVMAARARGLPEAKAVGGHALKSAMPAVLTSAAILVVQSLAGDALVEVTFARPGLGRLVWEAIRQNDIGIAGGALAVLSLLLILVLALVDVAYGLLDPRIRDAREREARAPAPRRR
ncbi:MAG: ABC transporter permease [Spirochaetaceae bacterium]|nr:ABC transporter permease [Spirochaetaceae bacterium]